MKVAILAVLLTALFVPLAAQATVYDLGADWSNDVNPFGAWTLMKSPTALFTINQTDFLQNGAGIRAWADQPYPQQAHVPAWYRNEVATPQYDVGDIYAHGAEFDRTGSNQTSAVWTSPETAVATISGAVWTTWISNRTMDWELRKNGVALTGGRLIGNGVYMHDTPFNLGSGWGGAGVLTQTVVPGDKIQLVFTSITENGNIGDGLGLRLTITTPSVATAPAGWLNPGWNYFSIPLDPVGAAEASGLLGFDCENILYQWNPVAKNIELYPSDFSDLARGRGYLLWLMTTPTAPSYEAYAAAGDFAIPLQEAGWTWIGQPFDHDTLLSACTVTNNATGVTRTAGDDNLSADPWINWSFLWWDSSADSFDMLSLTGSTNNSLLPWHGYLVWANTRDLTLSVPSSP